MDKRIHFTTTNNSKSTSSLNPHSKYLIDLVVETNQKSKENPFQLIPQERKERK